MAKCWCCGGKYVSKDKRKSEKDQGCENRCYDPVCLNCSQCVFHCKCARPNFYKPMMRRKREK